MEATDYEKIPHKCLIKLKSIYSTLKSAEKKAADFIFNASENVGSMGVIEFAAAAGCSEATAVRLAKRLGYSGYAELKEDFANSQPHLPYNNISLDDNLSQVLTKVFSNSIQALNDTLSTIDPAEFEKAVKLLVSANRIAFFGLGNAFAIAREAYQQFLRIGTQVYTAEDPDLQLLIISTQLGANDVIVAISYSGESKPIIKLCEHAKTCGIKVIGITNFPLSSLAKLADVKLQTAVFQEHVNGEIVSKRLAQLCIVEGLYISYLIIKNKQVKSFLKKSENAIKVNKFGKKQQNN